MKEQENDHQGQEQSNQSSRAEGTARKKHASTAEKELRERMSRTATAAELVRLNITELPYLLAPIIPQIGIAAVGGSSDAGKSTWLRGLALATVRGEKEYLGFKLKPRHNAVIYVSTEDDYISTAFLLHQSAGNVDLSALENLVYVFDTHNILEKLESLMSQQPVDMVIIDTFTDMYGGSMNETNAIRSYINSFSSLFNQHECLGLFLHHTGKKTDLLPPSKRNLLGSQGFEAKMRVVFELRKDLKDNTLRHLCIVKGNYIPDSEKDASFVLSFENRIFTNTGNRVPFNKIVGDNEDSDLAKQRACFYFHQGLSVREIVTQLRAEGHDYGKSTVALWVKECGAITNSKPDEENPDDPEQETTG